MSEYLSSFNAGQLSPLLDSRTDLALYRSGCKTLRNMYVKPQGGVERRQGTQHLLEAQSDNARLIPFVFTRDTSYMLEFDSTYIRILGDSGEVLFTLDSPYDVPDIADIKFTQVADILWLVCPNKKPFNIKRTALSPITFVIEEVPFSYPPLLPENTDINSRIEFKPLEWSEDISYEEDSQVEYLSSFYENASAVPSGSAFNPAEWTEFSEGINVGTNSLLHLYSNEGVFNDGTEEGYLRVSHQRASETTALEGYYHSYNYHPDPIEVGYTDWVYVGDTSAKATVNFSGGMGPLGGWAIGTNNIEMKEGVSGVVSTYGSYTFSRQKTVEVTGLGDTYIRLALNQGMGWYGVWYSVKKFNANTVFFESSDETDKYSDVLDVSFSNWTITTSDKWTGSLEVERSTDGGGTWEPIAKVIDTAGMSTVDGETQNVTFTSPTKEGRNTKIRLVFLWSFGTIKVVLENDNLKSEGLLRIVDYEDEHNVVAIVVNSLLNAYPTAVWSEGAFSTFRGFPSAITQFQNRIVYSGTLAEPNTVYMSEVDDYHNFLMGIKAANPIKVTPNTNEPTNWLLTKSNVLYQGTRGSVVVYKAYDNKAISPTNVSAINSLEFGGSTIQGIPTNETVVFLERLNSKLREAFYSEEESGLVSRDLTIMSDDIASPYGFTELALCKTPDQIIYGLRDDGLISGLTYERSQDVIGWSVFDFGGAVSSINVKPTGEHDELWMINKRKNGTYIEKTGSRLFHDDLLDSWYVDSGVKTKLEDNQDVGSWSIYSDLATGYISIITTNHNLNTGDIIRLNNVTGTAASFLNQKEFRIAKVNDNEFKLKSIDDNYINSVKFGFDWLTAEVAIGPPLVPTPVQVRRYNYAGIKNNGIYYQSIDFPDHAVEANTGNLWAFTIDGTGGIFSTVGTTSRPPLSGWRDPYTFDPVNPEIVLHNDITLSGGDFTQVSKTWTGLDHLDGEIVQIQGDGGFAGTAMVSGGEVTSDEYYNQAVIGLKYLSILQPMFVEASNYPSSGYNKSLTEATLRFYRSLGGYSGILIQQHDRDPEFDFEDLNANFPDALDPQLYDMEPLSFRTYVDGLGESLKPFTGTKLVNYNDTDSRVKTLYVITSDPLPMLVQGMVTPLQITGD